MCVRRRVGRGGVTATWYDVDSPLSKGRPNSIFTASDRATRRGTDMHIHVRHTANQCLIRDHTVTPGTDGEIEREREREGGERKRRRRGTK